MPADRSRQLREPMGHDNAKEQENGFDSSFNCGLTVELNIPWQDRYPQLDIRTMYLHAQVLVQTAARREPNVTAPRPADVANGGKRPMQKCAPALPPALLRGGAHANYEVYVTRGPSYIAAGAKSTCCGASILPEMPLAFSFMLAT